MVTLYSLIWTVIISCPIILLIFVLRRKSTYLMKYGVTFVCILYAFCAVRMLLPVEIPAHQKVICDPYVYSFLMKKYAELGPERRQLALVLILGVWLLGIVIASIYYFITVGLRLIKFRRYCYKGDGRAERILKKIDPDSKIEILYTNLMDTPFLVGLFRPTIYLTEVECTDKQIEYILMHEYTHWKRKDPWKQLFSYLMVIIFWWNPLFRLLNADIKRLIEMGCDKTMLRKYSKRYAFEYLKTMCDVKEASKGKLKNLGFSSLSFVGIDSEEGIKQRIYYTLDAKDNLKVQKKINTVVICLCLIWMIFSYYFILQPVYSPNREIEKLEQNDEISVYNGDNAYLERQESGSYILYFGNSTQEVPEEDVEAGFYDMYPIIEKK